MKIFWFIPTHGDSRYLGTSRNLVMAVRVRSAEPLRLVTALWKPNDPRYPEQWNFRMIGMEKAWDKTKGKG